MSRRGRRHRARQRAQFVRRPFRAGAADLRRICWCCSPSRAAATCVQLARFATARAQAGHRVAIATQPAYVSMFAGVAGIERVITDIGELAALGPLRWDMLVSVAGATGVTPDTIPRDPI